MGEGLFGHEESACSGFDLTSFADLQGRVVPVLRNPALNHPQGMSEPLCERRGRLEDRLLWLRGGRDFAQDCVHHSGCVWLAGCAALAWEREPEPEQDDGTSQKRDRF